MTEANFDPMISYLYASNDRNELQSEKSQIVQSVLKSQPHRKLSLLLYKDSVSPMVFMPTRDTTP
jgi:hypothetical protein